MSHYQIMLHYKLQSKPKTRHNKRSNDQRKTSVEVIIAMCLEIMQLCHPYIVVNLFPQKKCVFYLFYILQYLDQIRKNADQEKMCLYLV